MSLSDLFKVTTDYEAASLWDNKGSHGGSPVSFWRPKPPPGYFLIGDWVGNQYDAPGNNLVRTDPGIYCVKDGDYNGQPVFAQSVDFQLIWKDQGSGANRDGAIWAIVPPAGYVALGCMVSSDYEKPDYPYNYRCILTGLTVTTKFADFLWDDQGSRAYMNVCLWNPTLPVGPGDDYNPNLGTFIAAPSDNYDTSANPQAYYPTPLMVAD